LQDRNIKDKIIQFVINAPVETNIKVATFIARIQAQKDSEELCNKTQKSDHTPLLSKSIMKMIRSYNILINK
jgi:5,10-methylene-tetrahydrofolate dehydrogenase/methenyl tetrahydrofolate cyclohydrolase